MRKHVVLLGLLLLTMMVGNAHARFVSTDPVQANANNGQNFNRYHYANNNPYKFTDPDGRESASLHTQERYQMTQPSHEGVGLIADFVPIVGDIKGIVEAIQNPSLINIGAAGVGLIPVVGDVGGALIKNADSIGDAARAAPDFVVSPGGTAFPVPQGAAGPTPVINPAGNETGAAFTGGTGGANGQVSTMRIMNPNAQNPSGYVKYENSAQPKPQGVDPYSGRTVPPEKAHHKIDR